MKRLNPELWFLGSNILAFLCLILSKLADTYFQSEFMYYSGVFWIIIMLVSWYFLFIKKNNKEEGEQ